uniref:Iron-sulfur cluster biosynthesis protein n=1 Tax=Marseillevirus LCMAC202 TaxID=2506606 RepID=A0A481Z0K0_9VIRU|nr:MAG: iron-sulfur cluster biosynthesis protein [Marseillevirus LCMAC202]
MLRVTIDSGGCNGFSYNYRFDDKIYKNDIVIEQNGATVVVDDISANFVNGATIDYKDELIRSGFIIDKNPNADTACSCKISFSMKD